MIWLNPWAWLGVIGVALPAIIHLLGRGHATTKKFPTLRFIDPSRLLPTRRTRIHDAWLLAVRVAIIAIAAAALAQPLLLTSRRRRSLDRGVARAVIVDTSWSMTRRVASGRPRRAVDVALDSASALVADAQASEIMRTASPRRGIASAVAWIERQQRRGEIVMLSDYQAGTVDSGDVSIVPSSIAVNLLPVRSEPQPSPLRQEFRTGNGVASVSTIVSGESSIIAWDAPRKATPLATVALLGAPGDRDLIDATRIAAGTIGSPGLIDSARSIAIVFPRSENKAALLSKLAPVSAPWERVLVGRLMELGMSVETSGDGEVAGRRSLILFTTSEPGSIESARLLAAVERGSSVAPEPAELEPGFIGDVQLRGWSHAARPVNGVGNPHRVDGGPSDGRWLWALVLALLGLEAWMRRPGARPSAVAEAQARAA